MNAFSGLEKMQEQPVVTYISTKFQGPVAPSAPTAYTTNHRLFLHFSKPRKHTKGLRGPMVGEYNLA